MLPTEVVEQILKYCDGKTLKCMEQVNNDLKCIVHSTAKRLNLWEKCCHDFPPEELNSYKSTWIGAINWEYLLDNWFRWSRIKPNISFHCTANWKINKVSCIAITGEYLATGLSNGSVKIFSRGRFKRVYNHQIVQVESIHFMQGSAVDNKPAELLIAYPNKVYVNDLEDTYASGTFPNCYIFSTYKRHICGVSIDGHITIAKVITDEVNHCKSHQVLTFGRVYSPDTVQACALAEGVCVVLVKDHVRLLHYQEGSRVSQLVPLEMTMLSFATPCNLTTKRDIHIFHGKVVVAITKSLDVVQQQLLELFILNDKEKSNSKKMFMPWRVFKAFITCVHLYGNTFVIGMSSGWVYFYNIDDWKQFDIVQYAYATCMPDFMPVLSMATTAERDRRTFYIATNTNICELVGKTSQHVMPVNGI